MEPIPFLRLVAADHGLFARPLGWDLVTCGDGHEERVVGAFLIDCLGDLARGFLFLGADAAFRLDWLGHV